MRAATFVSAAAAAAFVTLMSSQLTPTGAAPGYPAPPAWPAQHYHREMMYTPAIGEWNDKPFYYDYTNMHMRVDSLYAGGTKLPPYNFTSYWLNNDLYMYIWDGNQSCVHLDMGFGMPRPDWFVDGYQLNTTWLAKKSDDADNGFHNTVWTRKCATCDTDPNGYFNYFSTTGDNGDAAGVPFRLEAPGPVVYVLNEYFDFENTVWGANSDIFALPATPVCQTQELDVTTHKRIAALAPEEQEAAFKAAKVDLLTSYLKESGIQFPELLMALA